MSPEFGFWIAPNWSQIGKTTTTPQFIDLTSSSNFFHIALFLLSSFVAGPCKFHHWYLIYANFLLLGIDQKSGNWNYPRLGFAKYLETGSS